MEQNQEKTLSSERVKVWVREKMSRGRWVYIADIPHLKAESYREFVGIIKEIINSQDYGDQKIWIELDRDHIAVKIFEYSGFYKQSKKDGNKKNSVRTQLGTR